MKPLVGKALAEDLDDQDYALPKTQEALRTGLFAISQSVSDPDARQIICELIIQWLTGWATAIGYVGESEKKRNSVALQLCQSDEFGMAMAEMDRNVESTMPH